MSFYNLAKKRYSSRKYKDQPLDKETIIRILDTGRIAPSAVNFQPWHFIVVDEEELKQKIFDTYNRDWIKTAPVVIIICADHSTSWKRRDGKDHADIDAAIATDHITLAAADEGLATCWVCNFDKEKCIKILDLPENVEPVVYLPLGYPEDKPSKKHDDRKSMEEIIHWNTFRK